MLFIKLPIEIILNKILTFLSMNDLIEFSKTCKYANVTICIYLKCNNCNKKIQNNNDLYIFKKCHDCKKIICKSCQSFCNNYEYCENTFCDNCLILETCDSCEEYFQTDTSGEDY